MRLLNLHGQGWLWNGWSNAWTKLPRPYQHRSTLSRPTILLIPGALTELTCYDLIVPALRNASSAVGYASLASTTSLDPEASTAEMDGEYLSDEHVICP